MKAKGRKELENLSVLIFNGIRVIHEEPWETDKGMGGNGASHKLFRCWPRYDLWSIGATTGAGIPAHGLSITQTLA
jgi:hypothetical protein